MWLTVGAVTHPAKSAVNSSSVASVRFIGFVEGALALDFPYPSNEVTNGLNNEAE
jgi:hypothetical protein